MENIYQKKLAKLESVVSHLKNAISEMEDVVDIEMREGDRDYANTVYAIGVEELETQLQNLLEERDAVRAMVE